MIDGLERQEMMRPYLSVVAASRNDDHGGDPLHRTQIFINCFAQQCEEYRLPAELILIDWNPVADRPGLASVLHLPPGATYCSSRVITVPSVLHRTVKYSDRLAFFQMIAKNVGIRRANAPFVLATNIDILFSDELIAFLSKQNLDPRRLYRVDRYDVKADLPADAGVDIVLDKAWRSVIRTNRRANLQEVIDPIYDFDQACRDCGPHVTKFKASPKIELVDEAGCWHLRPHPDSPIEHLNTNACGDFTLLAKEAWEDVRGYPEFEAFSFNIDSMGLVAAHYHGYRETSLLPPCVCFHIEHGLGSGYTPEGEQTLFDRIRAKRILSPDWCVLNGWVETMRLQQKAIQFNDDNWGLAGYTLPEEPMGSAPRMNWDEVDAAFMPVPRRAAALRPEYDLDSVTLFFEREAARPANIRAPAIAAQPAPVPDVAADEDLAARESRVTHDETSLLGHYAANASPPDRPVVVWASGERFARLKSQLSPHLQRELISGEAFASQEPRADRLNGYDGCLLATDPRQMILDLSRFGLLNPRSGDFELVICMNGEDGAKDGRWSPSVSLARRLLAAAGWNVVLARQPKV